MYFRRSAETCRELGRYDVIHHPKFKKKDKAQPKFYADSVKISFTENHVILEKIATSIRRNRTVLNKIRLSETGRIPTDAKYANPRVTFDGLNWLQSRWQSRWQSQWQSVGVETAQDVEAATNDGTGVYVGANRLVLHPFQK